MLIFTIVVVAVLALVFVVLGISGILPSGHVDQGAEISTALRELLLARAEGKVSDEEFEDRQTALHASLIASPQQGAQVARRHLRWSVSAAIAVIAVLPIVLYTYLGKPKETEIPRSPIAFSRLLASEPKSQMQPQTLPQIQPQPQAQANSGGDLNTAVKRLADKMVKDPNNGEGWLLLARTYGELRQHKEAADAYARAAAILPPDATLLADWADARVMINERKWDDESHAIVKRALAADPKHLKALALAGSEAFYHADYKLAVSYWKRIQAAAPTDSKDAKLAEMNIQEANAMLAKKTPARNGE